MAKKFTTVTNGINLGAAPSAPLNPSAGDIYYDSSLGAHRFYNGSQWVSMSRSEYDNGIVYGAKITVDLNNGLNQRALIRQDADNTQISFVGGLLNNTYRIKFTFDDTSNYSGTVSFNPAIQIPSGAVSQITSKPNSSFTANCVVTPIGIQLAVEQYDAYTYVHPIDSLLAASGDAFYNFAYLSSGSPYIFGDSTYGQYGTGTVLPFSNTLPLSPNSSRSYSQIVFGYSHCVAVEASTGFAWAWGLGTAGQLGNSTITNASSPVSVFGGRSWASVYASQSTNLAIEASTGFVWGWGNNLYGELGDGTTVSRSSPVSLAGGRAFKQVAVTQLNGAGIEASTGYAYTWGYNSYGQLGIGTTANNSSSPVSVFGGRSFNQIIIACGSGMRTMVALEGSTGRAWTWGTNYGGELGINTTGITGMSSPVSVFGGRSFSKVTATGNIDATTSCTIFAIEGSTGYAYYWGGGLFGSSHAAASSPTSVVGGRSYTDVKGCGRGAYFSEVSTGLLYAWGSLPGLNRYSDGTLTLTAVDPALHGNRFWSQLSSSVDVTAAIESSTGRAYVWGVGGQGQIGNAATSSVYSPVSVFGGRSFSQIVTQGNNSACFVAGIEGATGNAYVWGYGNSGVLGNNTSGALANASSPVSVFGGRSFRQLAASGPNGNVLIAIEGSTGRAWAWGANQYGALGVGTMSPTSSPTSVLGGRSWRQLAISKDNNNTSAIEASTGNVYSWGNNSFGQLGTGDLINTLSPVSTIGGKSFTQLAIPSGASVLALEGSTGFVWGWGLGTNNLLLNGSTQALSPVVVSRTRSYTQLYAALNTVYALEGSTGNLYMWGTSSALTSAGQYQYTSFPTLLGPPKSWKQFATGSYLKDSVIVQDSFNTMYYWGDSVQLGVGYGPPGATVGLASSSSPVPIARSFPKT